MTQISAFFPQKKSRFHDEDFLSLVTSQLDLSLGDPKKLKYFNLKHLKITALAVYLGRVYDLILKHFF